MIDPAPPSSDFLGRIPEPLRAFVAPLLGRSDLGERLARMALIFPKRFKREDREQLACLAREAAPGNYRVRLLTQWIDRRQAPLWHFSIIDDGARNQVYAKALEYHVKPGMTVFEIGTGTGILAMLAARAGAGHVYTCERRPEVAEAAREIIAANGFADRVTVIAKSADDLVLGEDMPERADLFVAEIVDNSLLGEMVIPLTELARQRFLKPDAILLPHTVSAIGYLVAAGGHGYRWRMTEALGFDLSAFNRFAPMEVNAGETGGDVDPLGPPTELLRVDLRQDQSPELSLDLELAADRDGLAEGVMRWLHLDFGGGITFENSPPTASAWFPQIHVLPEARQVKAGERLDFELYRSRERLMLFPK